MLALVCVKRSDSFISISMVCVKRSDTFISYYITLSHMMFKPALQGVSRDNFLMLYCCKDYKNVTRDKKFRQSRFFVRFSDFGSSLKKYKKFFRLRDRKFHFPKYKKFFQSGFFIFRARKVTS